jgi:hypothetical protein
MARIDKQQLESIDIHSLPDVMSIAFWVMEYLNNGSFEYFGASKIAQYVVEKLGISTSRQAVHAALTKAVSKKFCHRKNDGFGLMKLGQDELLKQMQKEKVILLEPGKPFAAGIRVDAIFSSAKNVLKISDPYVDIKTLDVIYRCIGQGLTIKLLTAQVNNESNFKREIQKMILEGFNIEVRRVSTGVLHDRYFMDDTHFWLSGNSLNNLGKKESFIVMLGDDVQRSMSQTFDSRWQSAITI